MNKNAFLSGTFFGCMAVFAGGAPLVFAQTGKPSAAPAAASVQPKAQPVAASVPAAAPMRDEYLEIAPDPQMPGGRLLLPSSFLQAQMGISVDAQSATSWKLSWFGQTVQMDLGSKIALNGKDSIALAQAPVVVNGQPYFPWEELAKTWHLEWKQYVAPNKKQVLWVRYPAAYLENITYSGSPDKFRVVYTLSNPTLIQAQSQDSGAEFDLAAARRGAAAAFPAAKTTGDPLVSQLSTSSGDWKAALKVQLKYQAPVAWFTMDNPPRLVVDVQRNFEEISTKTLDEGLTYQHIRRGLWRGPQLLYVVHADPAAGWRLTVAGAGYSVLQRDYTSHQAKLHSAPVATNGGFFAYDGAAVGALKVQGEWLRLPWKGRTSIGFAPDGGVKIENLHVDANAVFGNGKKYPVKNLNGFPSPGIISAITRHLADGYTLKAGEMALVVHDGKVTAKPGSGRIELAKDTFALVASGAARPYLEAVARGTGAELDFEAPGWENYPTILGAGPRLVNDGQVHVPNEGFRPDVTEAGPRTAVGVDKDGKYIVVVADGRRPLQSVGLTLNEMGATMLSLGAVNAINFDGGGSSAMAIDGKLVNHPSDGYERQVSNVFMVLKP